jgi:hypothetical protein
VPYPVDKGGDTILNDVLGSKLEGFMRGLTTPLLLLFVGASTAAQAQTCPSLSPPCKVIRIINNNDPNDPTQKGNIMFPILEVGARGQDDWLRGQFNVQPAEGKTRLYATTRVIRFYVGQGSSHGLGLAPGESVDITLPFYSTWKGGDGSTPDGYIDWWNGGRVYLYDKSDEINAELALDSPYPIAGVSGALPCVTFSSGTGCAPVTILGPQTSANEPRGLVATDHAQLMEYTLGTVVTANGLPYKVDLGDVGYNISSVDQTYLPVAMQPLDNPVPYIGLAAEPQATWSTFRSTLNKFSSWTCNGNTCTATSGDFKGWPVYRSTDFTKTPPLSGGSPPDPSRPRFPGAFNVFANAFGQNTDVIQCGTSAGQLKQNCPAVAKMYDLFKNCTGALCQYYSPIIQLFQNNLTAYKAYACSDPKITGLTGFALDIKILSKIYGWVPFNEKLAGCTTDDPGQNDLLKTAGDPVTFNLFQQNYIQQLQQSKGDGGTYTFNPYVKLIHDEPNATYLAEAAYAFSIDDEIGFQVFPAGGLIIASGGGCKGLIRCEKLDRNKRVELALGVKHAAAKQWAAIGFCRQDANKNLAGNNVTYYPPSYPCVVTVTDLAGQRYQFNIVSGPDASKSVRPVVNCVGVVQPNPTWCSLVQVNQMPNTFNYINTGSDSFGPPASTHDFNGDGISDIAWRDTIGNVAIWLLLQNSQVNTGGLGTIPSAWSIVGQRDFDSDGKHDLLWRDTSGNLALWLMNGTSVINDVFSPKGIGNVATNWTVVGTCDFNDDGRGDILWLDNSGNVAIWLMDGARIATPLGFGNVGTTWRVVGTGDFNNDQHCDILWRDASGNTAIWFMKGSLRLDSAVGIGTVATAWSVVGTGDFNGDGMADILWRDTSGNTAIWLMNGAQILQAGGLGNIATIWSVGLTGDFNFDKKSDILWRDTSGNTAIWFMNGLQIGSTAGLGNIPTTWTVQGMNAD